MSYCGSDDPNCTCPLEMRPPPHRKFIATMANRITPLGFPTNLFDSENYLRAGYFDKNFASLLRLLSPYTDDKKLERVLMLGIKLNFFNSIPDCQPNEFYNFLRHLRTRAGQDELQKLAVREKIEKRAAACGFNVKEMASILMAEAQKSDLSKPKNVNKLKIVKEVFDDLDCVEGGDPSGTNANDENVLDGEGSSSSGARVKRPKLEL